MVPLDSYYYDWSGWNSTSDWISPLNKNWIWGKHESFVFKRKWASVLARKQTYVFSQTRKFMFQGIFSVEPHSIRLRHMANNFSIKEESFGREFKFSF